jgi:transcriptional regulator with XRE-family HTH domain
MTLAEKLRRLREGAGLTQEQLADRSGINLWTIRGYEQGRREPNWKGIICLASGLGVAVETFAECEEASDQAPRPRGRPRKEQAVQLDQHATESATLESGPGPTPAKKGRAGRLPATPEKPRGRKARRPRG